MKFLFLILFPFTVFANGETITSNMGLIVPTVGVTTGPQYAADINMSLGIIDKHNHSPGYGVPITPSGLNISSDLTFQGNNLTNIRAARFSTQSSSITPSSPDIAELYSVNGDLYYNDTSSHAIRITQSGSVAGASGTITGLPSGTASAAYSSGTFSFQQSTGVGANIDAATYILRYPGSYPTPSGNYIALQAPSGLSSGFSITFPASTPSNTSFMAMSNAGVISAPVPVSQGITASNIANGTITTTQISSSAGILGSQMSSSAGIIGSQIANQTIAQGNLAARSISSSVGAGGVAISSSSGTFTTTSTSFVNVTNLSVTITTTGRPVYLAIQAVAGTLSNPGFVFTTGSLGMQMLRAGSPIYAIQMNAVGGNLTEVSPNGMMVYIDTGVAGNPGTYTYSVQVINESAGTIGVENCVLIAYEI